MYWLHPTPSGCHAAALVNGVMHAFGGCTTGQTTLGDLIALQLWSE
jgi:hypothetical protein